MNNRLTITERFGITAAALLSLSLIGSVGAQNPRPYPALKGGAGSAAAASQTPAPKSNKLLPTGPGTKLSSKDKTFMMKAAQGGMLEVEWGKMAARDGKSAAVKSFGNRMVTDHSKANNELMALMKEEGMAPPRSVKPAENWKSDKDYMAMMVSDHETDLAEFQSEAKDGADPDVKQFASKYSKMVKKHLDLARETQGKLK